MRGQRDTESDFVRGEVEIDADSKLQISSLEDDSCQISLTETESDAFRNTLRAFFCQTIALYENPQNKTHLTIGGETICHYNARAPPNSFPYGTITAATKTTYNSQLDEPIEVDLPGKKAVVPLTVWEDGVLPQTNICQHCQGVAADLSLLPEQDLSTQVPGTNTPSCPSCDEPMQLHEHHNGAVVYIHADPDIDGDDCPLAEGWGGIKNDLDDETLARVTKKRLGIDGIDFEDAQSHTVSFPSMSSSSDIQLRWKSDFDFREFRSLTVEGDNKNIPEIGLVFEMADGTDDIILLYPDLVHILESFDFGGAVPPEVPEKYRVIDAENVQTQKTATNEDPEQPQSGASSPGDAILSPKIQETALAPLELSTPDITDFYNPETVAAFADHYSTQAGVREEMVEYRDGRDITWYSTKGKKPPSRHFHQRILGPTEAEIQPLLSRLGIPSDGVHHLVFGGFTGELADALNTTDSTVTFTDPMKEWCDAATERGGYNAVRQCKLGTIPATDCLDADTVISFECFHPIETVSRYTLFSLLKGSVTEYGILLVVSEESLRQMKHENSGRIGQMKSKWQLLEDVYELETRWVESDDYRIWNLRPESEAGEANQRLTDLLTIRALAELGLAKETDCPLAEMTDNHMVSPYPDRLNDPDITTEVEEISLEDNYAKLLVAHPLCESTEDLARSLGRLGTIFHSLVSKTHSRAQNRIYIGHYNFITDGPEKQFIREL